MRTQAAAVAPPSLGVAQKTGLTSNLCPSSSVYVFPE